MMVDGSHLSFNENAAYTKFITLLAHPKNMLVEAELGRLSGTEDDLTVEEYEARLTDVNMVAISPLHYSKFSSVLVLNSFMLVALISGIKIH